MSTPLVIALPKGRILDEVIPLLREVGIQPEDAFFDASSRKLQFACKGNNIQLIRVRSFDVATFVAFGAAHMGVVGSDVLNEFNYPDIYAPIDLGVGQCRLSLASTREVEGEDLSRASHVRVATKYPETTRRFFAERGIQAECIELSGAMELAPRLGLTPYIVDLVSSGRTLKENNLIEREVITKVSSRLIVHRTAFKTRNKEIDVLLGRFREVSHAA